MSLTNAKLFAKNNGFDFYFDWEAPRTSEGYYLIKGNVDLCARRAN